MMASFKTSTKSENTSSIPPEFPFPCNTISAIGDTTDARNLETNFSALVNLRYMYLSKKKKKKRNKIERENFGNTLIPPIPFRGIIFRSLSKLDSRRN